MVEGTGEGVRELAATLEAFAARPALPDGGDRELLAGRLIGAMRASEAALDRIAREDAERGKRTPEERARAIVEGGLVGLVGGLDRSLPRLEDELRRLGPSLRAIAVPLGAGLVEGLATELSARGPELAKATARLVGGLATELAGQALELGRELFGRRAPPHVRRPALVAAGAAATLALGAAAVLRRRRE